MRPPLRRALAASLVGAVLPGLVVPGLLGSAQAQETPASAKARVERAAGELEDSTAAVRAAAAALDAVAAQLPDAQADEARAEGALAGARARASAAARAADDAEQAVTSASAGVAAATTRVDAGRAAVDQFARRSYTRGPLADLGTVLTSGGPQDAMDRSALLSQVFRSMDDSLAGLARERLALSVSEHALQQEQQVADSRRAEADRVSEGARVAAVTAQTARARVVALVAQRGRALAAAQRARAGDAAEYRAAQAASKALAERIRKAAALARAREAARARAAAAAKRARAAARVRALAAARAAHRAAPRPAPEPPAYSAPRPPRSGGWLWPVDGSLTSLFGWRVHPIFGDLRFHAGIDIGAPYGAPVRAAAAGTVTYAGPATGYGTLILISHGSVGGVDITTGYAHQSALLVSVGQHVDQGQQVGRVGNEGNSTGPHLHFEVRRDGDPVDPLDYVSAP